MKSQFSTKYFPFAKGIPWKMKYSVYVYPEVSRTILEKKLSDKDVTVIAYGGLLESFFSLSILEMVNHFFPSARLFWAGNEKYSNLLKMNGLATFHQEDFSQIYENYPVPLFLDKNDGAYFNCLNNYINVKKYYLEKGYHDTRAAIKQIVEKGLFPWDNKFIPKLRNNDEKIIVNKVKLSKIFIEKPFVLIMPDIGHSMHNIDCLGWSPMEVKSLGAMLRNSGISLVVLSNNLQYYSPATIVLNFELETYLYLVRFAKAIISRELDYLFVAATLSDIKVISRLMPEEFKIKKNLKFLHRINDIYMDKELTPLIVWKYLASAL